MRTYVLMSTYNGAAYVEEQLRSILCQLPEGGKVLVRDDGSSDDTPRIVQDLHDPRIELRRGKNLGFGSSFLALLALVPDDAGLVMFSDQDDVWLPGKIERARAALAAWQHAPALYGSAQMLVDQDLRRLHPTPPWSIKPDFQAALTENMITGCTAAMNFRAVRLLQKAGAPIEVKFHDWWCYLVVSAFGTVVLDPEPTLLYRQHGGNQIGHGAGWWGRQRQMLRFIRRNDWVGILVAQVWALKKHFGSQLPAEAESLLARYFKFSDTAVLPSWRLVFSFRRWRHTLFGEFALRVLLAAYLLRVWPIGRRGAANSAGRRADN